MKICFPVRKQDGAAYASVEEVMDLIGREPHGTWLAGTNHLWHGGIHVSEVSAPGSVLRAETADTAVPLQCMAGGEVVAWRLNKDSRTAGYNGHALRYSTTFVLVKSLCQPDAENENSWLEFYSLYMGLAPLSAFPQGRCYKAITRVLTRQAGKYHRGSEEIAEAPAKNGHLEKDKRVIIFRQQRFRNNGSVQPYGLAQRLNAEGQAEGERFWVTLQPAYLEPDGEQSLRLPPWMARAAAQGVFDTVVKPPVRPQMAAGEAVGFLAEDIAPAGRSQVTGCHFAHIEVISTDPRMPGFLDNPGRVSSGEEFIRLHPGALLYIRTGEGGQSKFLLTETRNEKDGGKILRVAGCSPFKDGGGKSWFKVSTCGWMSEADVDLLHQYDLKELGFSALEEGPSPDVSKTLREHWVRAAYRLFSQGVGRERGFRQRQVADVYRHLASRMDEDGDGRLSGREIYNALHHPELGIRELAARLVVRHDSEWYGGSWHPRWATYLLDYDRLRIKYARQWLDDCEWMSQVEPFSKGEPVWHMHPVVFLDALRTTVSGIIIFPLQVKPENDIGKKWGETHYWRAAKKQNATTMDYPRGGGRKHAARDLYTKPYASIVAICPGKVLDVGAFYNETHQITVHHKAADGREFIVRYGEVNPATIKVRVGDSVIQGQQLGETGKLVSKRSDGSIRPTVMLNGEVVYMLHFELFTGSEGLNINYPLTDKNEKIYKRRKDLIDPVELLIEGYNNTFNDQENKDSRKNVDVLVTSNAGRKFIKGWEKLSLKVYNDANGFCTIGYGHLINRIKCEDTDLPDEFKNGISKDTADEMFDNDILKFELAVRRAVSVKLFQHEFDALVSLLFNCGENFFSLNKAPELISKLNNEQYKLAVNEFLDITSGGLSGLVKRRRAERNVFLNNIYDSTH